MNILDQYNKKALIISLNEEQIVLSKNQVTANLSKIAQLGLAFRHALDHRIESGISTSKLWTETLKEFQKNNVNSLNVKYPIGDCFPISCAFLYYVKNTSKFSFLNPYREQGGVVKLVWGNIRDEYFQTAVQIGNYIVDVANDTVDIQKEKVKISEIGNIDFKNFSSIEEFIRVKESYHCTKVFSNFILPEISDFYPLFSVKNNKLRIIDNFSLAHLMLERKCVLPTNKEKMSLQHEEQLLRFFHKDFRDKLNAISDLDKKQKVAQNMVRLFNKTF